MSNPETTSTSPVIEIRNLSFRYETHPALEAISLSVQRGEFLGIIGPNGGGKTTLLRTILGIERGYTGEIRMFGEDPRHSHGWRCKVGVVPQHQKISVRFPLRARDVVELGTYVRGGRKFTRNERNHRVEEALTSVGAMAYAKEPLWKLSGGQRQRILVARALASQPELLLLDEPTVGVDAEGQDLLLQWISHWKQQKNMTVLLVTHDIGVIAPIADKLACLNVRLHFHDRPDHLTGEVLEKTYGCPAEMIFHSAHSLPHIVVGEHRHS